MNKFEDRPINRCPGCGSEMISWPTPKNLKCSECGFTMFINIAAAVAVIMESRGKILFGVRKHDPGRGMLDLPGGFVDAGETAEEAVRREVKEELGIEITELRYLFSLPNRYPYGGIVYDTLDLIYSIKCDDPPEMKADDDLEDVIWIGRDKIEYDRIAFDSLRRAVRRYLETSI